MKPLWWTPVEECVGGVRRFPPAVHPEPEYDTARGMAEAIFKDPFPDLSEVEIKVGRKTPESLLSWMRDAADRGDRAPSCDVDDGRDPGSAVGDGVSAQINRLREEMRQLRCADVRILWQLVSVHEGIEVMRWLMEDRWALASRGNSLTGSLSSLVTVEEHGPWMYPCRESPSPTWPQVWTEREPEQRSLSDNGDSNHESYVSTINPESEGRLPRPSSSRAAVSWCTPKSNAQASADAAGDLSGASIQQSQIQGLQASPLKSFKTNARTIKMALLRSSRVRKEVTAHTSNSIFTRQSEETQRGRQTQESFRTSLDNTPEDNTTSSLEELNYMGSQDDVTFL